MFIVNASWWWKCLLLHTAIVTKYIPSLNSMVFGFIEVANLLKINFSTCFYFASYILWKDSKSFILHFSLIFFNINMIQCNMFCRLSEVAFRSLRNLLGMFYFLFYFLLCVDIHLRTEKINIPIVVWSFVVWLLLFSVMFSYFLSYVPPLKKLQIYWTIWMDSARWLTCHTSL